MKIKKSVFFLAHCDDEFGIYEDIRIHVTKKIPFHIVYLTASNLNKTNNKIRENETLSALKRLRVDRSQISFIGKNFRYRSCSKRSSNKSIYWCNSLIKNWEM